MMDETRKTIKSGSATYSNIAFDHLSNSLGINASTQKGIKVRAVREVHLARKGIEEREVHSAQKCIGVEAKNP